jgi:4-hydroxybenzoate polyprenyltransferase
MGVAAAGDSISWSRAGLLAVAILGNQLAVGWSNDYLDRETDRRSQREKPLVSGEMSALAVGICAILAALLSIVAAALLGQAALLWFLLGSAAGFAYNLGLKDTPLSWLPYLAAFAVLPLFAFAALDAYRSQLLWLYPIALPLAPAAHIANALPDIEADLLAGRGGLVTRLGRERALLIEGAGLLLSVASLALSTTFLPFDAANLASTIAAYCLLTAAAAGCYLKRRDRAAFRLVSIACLVFVVGSIWSLGR